MKQVRGESNVVVFCSSDDVNQHLVDTLQKFAATEGYDLSDPYLHELGYVPVSPTTSALHLYRQQPFLCSANY
jgi:hypothetical protein